MTAVLNATDSRVLEPPDLWRDRLPSGQRDQAPHLDDAGTTWVVPDADPVPLDFVARSGSEFREAHIVTMAWWGSSPRPSDAG